MKRRGIISAGLIKSLFLCGLILLIFSCGSDPEGFIEIDAAAHSGNFDGSIAMIREAQDAKRPLYDERNVVSLFLDLGMLEHYADDHRASSQSLLEAERAIHEAFTKSLTQGFMTFIGNDNSQEYPGEDFEDIYISIFNALNFYNMGQIEGAMVEIRKLTMSSGKLEMLSRKYEDARGSFGDAVMNILGNLGLSLNDALPQGDPSNFSNSALARYLAVLFYQADGNDDGARIEYEQLQAALATERAYAEQRLVDPSRPSIRDNPPRSIANMRNIPTDQARLDVIGFAGLSPIKTAEDFTGNFFFFQQNAELQHPIFNLPVLVPRHSSISRIGVEVGGQSFDLDLLEDMGEVSYETFNARFANMFFKTYLRVLIKYIAADQAARQAPNELVRMAGIRALIVGINATEGADIRMGRFLPNLAKVGAIDLDPGTYTVTVNYYSAGGGLVGSDVHENVEVRANALNLIQSVNLN